MLPPGSVEYYTGEVVEEDVMGEEERRNVTGSALTSHASTSFALPGTAAVTPNDSVLPASACRRQRFRAYTICVAKVQGRSQCHEPSGGAITSASPFPFLVSKLLEGF